mmetsp:Transcript_18493/g.74319  ORF Transcript_18493/g.74319 Transcript_18493/m.74319 type:complete len:100 (-) Transcript_18493:1865-2164(-)
MGYKRGIRLQYPKQVRIKVEGLETRDDTKFYLGKRVAYVYKASNSKGVGKKESKYRVIWGKVTGSIFLVMMSADGLFALDANFALVAHRRYLLRMETMA